MARVELRPGESQEKLLKRFRKKVMRSGILSTARKKRFHISKSEKRRMARRKAIRKQRKRQRSTRADTATSAPVVIQNPHT